MRGCRGGGGRCEIDAGGGSGKGAAEPAVRDWAEAIVASLADDDRFEYCAVLVHRPAVDGLVVVAERVGSASRGRPTPPDTVVPLDASVCGRVLQTAAPALLSDVRDVPHYREIPGTRMRSELAVPIVVEGAAVGVINVESGRVGAFDIGDLQRLEGRAAEAAATAPDAVRPSR